MRAAPGQGPTCVIGVGEVSVRVRGTGRGGRCQALTWAMARELAELEGASFAAVATDGRDHVEGVAGAWCDSGTLERAKSLDLRHEVISKSCDTNRALGELDQLIAGVRTGWNLCDLYVACGR
jgi:glycerate-2-kinase